VFGPLLHGEKVILRPPDESDPPRFVPWLADMEVTRYLGRRFAVALFQEEEWLKRIGDSKDDVVWMIEADGQRIGATGIHEIDWVNARAWTGTLIGDKSAWGKGYASDAMALRTEYAFLELNLHKLMTRVIVGNDPSRRALEKAGYRQVGVHREHYFREGRWHDEWIAEVLRTDWEQGRRRAGAERRDRAHTPPA
jgi:ribosomal-protein-alanine N-acetyltransferase